MFLFYVIGLHFLDFFLLEVRCEFVRYNLDILWTMDYNCWLSVSSVVPFMSLCTLRDVTLALYTGNVCKYTCE